MGKIGLVLALLALISGCEKPASTSAGAGGETESESKSGLPEISGILDALPGRKEKEPEKTPLPVERVLFDNQGRELDATVVGRTALNLTVIRRADEMQFDIPVESLSVEDQAWARTLAFQAAPKMEETEAEKAAEADPYVQSRLDQIARLEAKIKRYEGLAKTGDNPMMRKTYMERIREWKQDILKMKYDINNRGL